MGCNSVFGCKNQVKELINDEAEKIVIEEENINKNFLFFYQTKENNIETWNLYSEEIQKYLNSHFSSFLTGSSPAVKLMPPWDNYTINFISKLQLESTTKLSNKIPIKIMERDNESVNSYANCSRKTSATLITEYFLSENQQSSPFNKADKRKNVDIKASFQCKIK